MSRPSAPPSPDLTDLSRRLGRGAAWSAANQAQVKIVNILVMMVVARLVAPREFGVFAVAIVVHAIVSNLGELGVSSCLMRGDLAAQDIAPTIATISLVSSSVLATGMYLLAVPLSSALGSVEAAGPLRVMALAVLLVGLFAVPSAQLSRDFRQDRLFVATLVSSVPANLSLVLLALAGNGALAFAWSRVIGQLLMGLMVWWYAVPRYRPGLAPGAVGHLLRFGLPLAGANLVNYTVLNADYAIVGRLLGPLDLGLYVLAFNVASWSTSLMGAVINGVAMPAISRVKHDADAFRAALSGGVSAVALIALPFAAVSAALARPLMISLYGGRWAGAAPVLALLAPYGALSVLCLLLANVLVGLAKTRVLLLVQLTWLVALVPGMYIGVRVHGVLGAAVAHVVVMATVVLPTYLVTLRRLVGKAVLTSVLRPVARPAAGAAAAGATALVVVALPLPALVQLLVGGLAGCLVHLAVTAPAVQPLLDLFLPDSLHQRRPLPAYRRWARRSSTRPRVVVDGLGG